MLTRRNFFAALVFLLLKPISALASYIPGKTFSPITTAPVSSQVLVQAGTFVQTVTMPGAVVGQHGVSVMPLSDPGALIIPSAWVSAANTVTFRITNLSTLSTTSVATTWLLALVSKL